MKFGSLYKTKTDLSFWDFKNRLKSIPINHDKILLFIKNDRDSSFDYTRVVFFYENRLIYTPLPFHYANEQPNRFFEEII